MQVIQYYKEDVSHRRYNVEAWDSPIVILWQCIECSKVVYKCESGNVYGGLKALINKLFSPKIVIPSYCDSCLDNIGADLFCAPSDINKVQQDTAIQRKEFDNSIFMELEEFKEQQLNQSRSKHAEGLSRKILNIMEGRPISREDFIEQVDGSQLKKKPLKHLNKFYDGMTRYRKYRSGNATSQTALHECRQKISTVSHSIAEKYMNTEHNDNFRDNECRQACKEYERKWNRWLKTLLPCKLIVLYKYISLQVTGVAYQDNIQLNGAEIMVVEHALPVGSKWLKRMDKLFAKSSGLKNNAGCSGDQ